jgi:hypothetical protein
VVFLIRGYSGEVGRAAGIVGTSTGSGTDADAGGDIGIGSVSKTIHSTSSGGGGDDGGDIADDNVA